MDRLITISLDSCDRETEIEILQQKTGLTEQEAQEVVKLVTNLRSYGKGFCPSLRATLMIATISKKTKIPIIPDDPKFQTLCLDVLGRPMKQILPDETRTSIQEIILKEILRKEEKR